MKPESLLLQGDCLEVLKDLPDNSVDSLVTDPPAGISFMGKTWDGDKGGSKQWIAWMESVMKEALRVMKPGAHGLVWALPRTSHWTATALENAGFEIRDSIHHAFGSGFPKSHNVEKATGDSKYAGIGTALKPAHEVWWLVRKPCSEKTVAANVLLHGTGGLNIDASRISGVKRTPGYKSTDEDRDAKGTWAHRGLDKHCEVDVNQGRFPANLIFSHNEDCVEICSQGCAVAELDRQSIAGGMHGAGKTRSANRTEKESGLFGLAGGEGHRLGDSGGASRFFYVAKASKSDKGTGNVHPTVKSTKLMTYLINLVTPPGGIVLDPFLGSGTTGVSAAMNGFSFIGIEQNPEYLAIAEKRIANIGTEVIDGTVEDSQDESAA